MEVQVLSSAQIQTMTPLVGVFVCYNWTSKLGKSYVVIQGWSAVTKLLWSRITKSSHLLCKLRGLSIRDPGSRFLKSQEENFFKNIVPPDTTKNSSCFLYVVSGMGLEPISLAAGNFKSPVYTIPPPGQYRHTILLFCFLKEIF
ncbi:MAG: hypothetical protein UW27_C0017G0097 [Parcubacteria group bacterium GW2011_GWA1_44_13]|uniref:Uncharacterized protein n=1 Tax=Candidatus Nomurabacteria bacterium GW2011_GWB1_44_12 TaxID=1618748 RepID=A0A837IBH6_9BACT|nr:MAG: hypothetical protein UW17_C0003G0016 [Candidatus Nomurabacteria bacterium GW2011_GWD1_44_10]KKT36745.1 MAG: hypothetical protein UW25_C0004G0073 [Candidatus Nomurabacteria bacterium GW2011_GWB1_44_12]KKT37480.1 MAG: hypothetical protein UW27_C0017G0097 [Parcubacteria group bacterium GW2011_GWA1_44_13]KKT59837.1 MAG: hypothetical protein UW54_C0019G0010 [Parcubacteria group bacterium GW2011_GWC1_44_26]